MAKLRTVALWSGATLAAILITLTLTGAIGPVYRWMVRFFAPEVWSAIGTWVTAVIAIVAAAFAWSQVKVARETREEQAQPNVVLYTEPNEADWHILEIVIKNFGSTPAYNVRIAITPALQATPNLYSDDKIVEVPVPSRIPILVPGQAFKTIWDVATERHDHMLDLQRKLGKAQISLLDYYNQIPERRHTAKVTYTDIKRVKIYETEAELNFDMLDGTTQIDVNTVHNLTKEVEKLRKEMAKIGATVQGFSQEHKGVWVYHENANFERQHRAEKYQRIHDKLLAREARYRARDAESTVPAPETTAHTTPETAESPDDGLMDRVRRYFRR